MATQNLNLALQPIILDIDDITSQIATLLAAQTNDQERYALAEKIIIELLNKNKEQKELLETKDNERKDLLENNDKLLHEQEDLLHERETLLAMSAQQLGKIQALEKRLQAVEGHPGAIINQAPTFIQIPDTKANGKYFECIEIAKKYSDLQNIQYYNGRLFKSKERSDIIDRLTTPREKHPVTNFTEMRKTIHWLQQKLHTYSLHACADILDPKHEGRDLYEKWHTYWKNPNEEGKMAIGEKIQSSTILAEILRNIFSKNNPAMTLKFHHAYTKIPEDILGIYNYQIIKDQFPQATLDVIVRDIIKVLMFSLQASKYTKFDHWYRSFMKAIEDLNLLYGEITWEQTYLAIVIWALELMDDRYKLLRQHMKFKLPSDTKELLKNPNETLDNVIKMVTQWDTQSMSYQEDNGIGHRDHKQKTLTIMSKMLGLPLQNNTGTDEACPYCKKPHHTLKQCWLRKSDENLKDEVKMLIPSLKKIYKAQQDLLQQKGKFTTDQQKLMKSILRTLQGMTIGGNTMETLMNTEVHHQGEEKYPNRKYTPELTQAQGIPKRGREDENHRKYEEDSEYYETDQDGQQDQDNDRQDANSEQRDESDEGNNSYLHRDDQENDREDDGQGDHDNEYEPQDEGEDDGQDDYDAESQAYGLQDEEEDDYDEESQEHEPRDEGGDYYGEDYQDQDQSQDGEGDETDNDLPDLVTSDDDEEPANTEAGKEENSTFNTHESWWMNH